MNTNLASWWDSLVVYRQVRPRIMLFLGFSSGLPILLVFGTLSIWLRDAGVDRSTIGFVSWVALAYAFKWVWSPLVDRMPVPMLTRRMGRRRAWLVVSQVSVAAGLLTMAFTDPATGLATVVALAIWVAFSSATQDIVIDAYRIESADEELQGAMAAMYMLGYRIAMIVASAGVLWIAAWVETDTDVYEHHAWTVAYGLMALLMLVGLTTTLLIDEPRVQADRRTRESESSGVSRIKRANWLPAPLKPLASWGWRAVISPFADFIRRYGWYALLLLALIATYRISDIVLGVIANVFYVDLGFSKAQIADVTKVFGIAAFEAGQRAFGENYLQDAIQKMELLTDYPIEWHFIGRLQSNKTAVIAEKFSWVHTLDKEKHAGRLSKQRPDGYPPLQVCIQVNLSGEESKGGVQENELQDLATTIDALPGLQLRGLMTMPDPNSALEQQETVYRNLHGLKEDLNRQGFALDTLSMGMSNDMQIAICAGSTIVRVGTAIFGARE